MADSIRDAAERLLRHIDDYDPIGSIKRRVAVDELRAALAAQPPAPAPASDGEREEREELARKLELWAGVFDPGTPGQHGLARAATLLRQPAPAPAAVPVPENADQAALMVLLGHQWLAHTAPERLRAPAPAAVPVAVSQRPWEREGWCDEEGRYWWFNRAGIPEWQLADGGPYGDFCLPHWAIPIPQPPHGGEVG